MIRNANAEFVDALREFLGLEPLYLKKKPSERFCRAVWPHHDHADTNGNVRIRPLHG